MRLCKDDVPGAGVAGDVPRVFRRDSGQVRLRHEAPRDRAGSFDPQLIAQYQRRFSGFDDKIISRYARGMTTREITGGTAPKAIYCADYLAHSRGDAVNAVLAAVGYNFRLLLRRLALLWAKILDALCAPPTLTYRSIAT